MRLQYGRLVGSFLLVCALIVPSSTSADQPAQGAPAAATSKPPRDRQELYKELAEKLHRVKLTGNFTIHGKDGPLVKEEYYILSAKKLDQGEMWLLNARIKYGDHDLTVPLPLEIQWAAETPVITLDKLTIPGLGTFGARVLFHEKSYAGTWSHDKVGGHLFGTFEKMKDE
ncbi:MAG: hypothetical protein FJ295_09935 [Planctomycetes bacterium]|nr:hypothetical protein [Planctomycetota bacterium]